MDKVEMDMERAKVFGIGFHKTGTTSLTKALRILGYNAIHGDSSLEAPYGDSGRSLLKLIKAGNYRLPTIDRYDAFTDNPYFSIWKELDREYPGSKFILTIREEEEWIKSCIKYFADREILPMREWMLGEYANPAHSEAAKQSWLDVYRNHNEKIVAHFRERSKDLLILNISKGEGWDMLCPFLEIEFPKTSFPKENAAGGYSWFQEAKNAWWRLKNK